MSDASVAASSFPGESGSIPLAPTRFHVSVTPWRQEFYKAVGDAVFQLNTIIVGLEQIAKGHVDHDLSINWPVPINLRAAADQSRHLALSGVLLLIHSRFENYITQVARDALWPFDDSSRQIILKSSKKQISPKKFVDYSVFERTRVLMDVAGCFDEIALGFVDAGTTWRNTIVHQRADSHMDSVARGYLKQNALAIRTTHSGIDVDRMIESLEKGSKSLPTLKETTTIIAFLIRAVDTIDNAFVAHVFSKDDAVQAYAIATVKKHAQANLRSFLNAHIVGNKKCRARLRQILIDGGFRDGDGLTGHVGAENILGMASLPRSDFLRAFEIEEPQKQ